MKVKKNHKREIKRNTKQIKNDLLNNISIALFEIKLYHTT